VVRVTESAISLLRELSEKHRAPDKVLRIVADEDTKGYKLALSEPQAGDEPIEDQGQRLAAIDSAVAAALSSSSLVSQTTAEGPQLAVNTPQPYPFGPISEIVRSPE
jgi:hypothetical protein